jgi:hypothetical protein
VIALGTDWTYSGSANMLRELACADQLNRDRYDRFFSDADLWRMVTSNAAAATGNGELLGSLEVGKLADISVFRAEPGETYRAVVESGQADVALVVRDGDVLYGEADVVEALDSGCETVEICGNAQRICAQREFGGTYAALTAAVPNAYPSIICEAPEDEPTCLPSRPTEYDGVQPGDGDGDGIADGSDNCATVFNPVRPMDHDGQADVDDDGIGDACDPTPVGDDLDNDSFANAVDLCPFQSDDQSDADTDGKGDVCDACDDQPNPARVCLSPPTPIYELQTDPSADGKPAWVVGAVVTGVAYNGFTMQDPTIANAEFAGIFVFTNNRPALAIGETVEVRGTIDEYNGLTEIVNATIVSHAAGGTVPAPVELTVAQAADEKWESVLVKLTDVSAVENPYTCSCGTDVNMWRVNASVIGWGAMYPGTATDWQTASAGVTAGDTITGVLTYRYNAVRIMPRQASDL